MTTEAIFENTIDRLQLEIKEAKKSIFIAVPSFTNLLLFNELVLKAREGCKISMIVSSNMTNKLQDINFDLLTENKSFCIKVENSDKELSHNKFCIIDSSIVIIGSYNWGEKEENNFENVIITHGNALLAQQFISKFNGIRKQYFPNEPAVNAPFPLGKIVKRLEILKNYILLEDVEEFKRETDKLNEYDFNADLHEIITDVQQSEFTSAIKRIDLFITKNKQLSIWNDTEIITLKIEFQNLENQLSAIDNERVEYDKLLSNFHHRHTIELGNIILEILRLKMLKFKANKERFAEAERDESQYRTHFDVERKKCILELTEEEKLDLKKRFRKASILCHPDKVSDEFKNQAQNMFIELKDAYDSNDLKRVTEILQDLQSSSFFKSKSETLVKKDLLKAAIIKLRKQIKQIEDDIYKIKESDTYNMIIQIKDWDIYFEQLKAKLNEELEELRIELELNNS